MSRARARNLVVDGTRPDLTAEDDVTLQTRPAPQGVLTGTPVVPGVGTGPVVRPAPRPALPAPAGDVPEAGRAAERERFTAASAAVADRLAARAAGATGAAAEVLAATAGLARDRGLLGAVEQAIAAGSPAPQAAVAAVEQFAALFAQLGGVMAERVTDLHDLRDRLLAEMAGEPEPGVPSPEEPSVLLADDLAPADTAGLDPTRVVALATRLGGPTSHTAIIARQLGIPCVVAVPGLDAVAAGTRVLVDGGTGEVVVGPDPAAAAERTEAAAARRRAVESWRGPGRTADGHRVEVLANVQDGAGARAAASGPAEGVGLFRTELAFLDRETEPTVEEQAQAYAGVLEAFAGRKVVLRTLDAGSDKPLAFAGAHDEPNPALGVRGLRIALDDPGILDRQLDGVALAAERTGQRPWVMAPMVATPAEAAFFAERARTRDLVPGVMVEVPAAALRAEQLLRSVDFLSLGTNDLSQYTMAADRLSAELATLTDPWQPAVLDLVARTAAAGRAAGKPVGVCGEAAADPLLGCVLVGLGVTSLSAAAAAVAGVGARLAAVDRGACEEAARAVLACEDPASAREAARAVLG
ncbi:putative PEP-binding protein [Quadrisphaera sp. DSM 44207]|uniref:putative PEP-binding protein n=1 Tax=Quadrisphaera sp. DSM 44207 TaxID=1881057 RepID=UPI00088A5B18|nr:putative PEP-binding protein [Quadrisphaera sp. DSM 44207]SDQ19139.1 phosphoenolpyruvate--protein phosphotransferase [Quadrisphaera sp. DSM 44207]